MSSYRLEDLREGNVAHLPVGCLEVRASTHLLGQLGPPEVAAGAITLLLSPESAYVPGQNVVVDGGAG